MPTWEFHCTKCEHITDFFCGFDERPNSILCEECKAKAEYQISAGTRPLNGGTPIFHGGQTIGDLFDQGGVEFGSDANKKASKERIKKMRKKHD